MANEYLKRTPTSTGNRRIFTYAGWFKKNNANGSDRFGIFNAYNTGSQAEEIGFRADSLRYLSSGSSLYGFDTTNKYRDTGNWFHIVFALNTTLESERKRSVIYINGVEVDTTTSSGIGAYVAKNFDSIAFNVAGKEHNVLARKYSSSGRDYVEGGGFDVFFVDGQALTPDVFGFHKDGDGYVSAGSTQVTDFRPGQWMPHSPAKIKKDINRRGGFGANGFYLPMNDSSNPGADFHCAPNSIITLKGEDLPQPRNGAPTTSDAYVSQLRQETGTLGFDGCIKLDGNQGLSIADTAALDLGTGDFTIEGFYYLRDEGTYHALFDFRGSGGDGHYPALFRDTTENKLYYYVNSSVRIDDISMRHGEWMHVAICKNSGTTRAFVDGKLAGSYSDSTNYISRDLLIGLSNANSNDLFGFVSNFRIVKGTGLYTANFTPPTEPLTAVTNTLLLCANSTTSATASTVTPSTISAIGSPIATRNELTGSIVLAVPGIAGGQGSGYGDYSADIKGSGTNKTLTAAGNASVAADLGGYYGSAMTFDGNGDEFTIPANVTDLQLGGGDFTVEAWIYPRAYNSGNMDWIGKNGGSATASEFEYGILSTGQLVFYHSNGSTYSKTGIYGLTLPNGSAPVGQWTHVASVRHGNTFTAYINGVAAGVVSNFLNGASMPSGSADTCIGSDGATTGTNWHWDGRIQDLRIYKGIAKYKGGFDVSKPYTPVGIEAFRTTTDTCKNNFATLNPLVGVGIAANDNAAVLKDGNLYYDNSNQSWTISTIGVSSGKYYAEFMVTGGTIGSNIGVCGDNRHGRNNQQYHAARGISYIRLASTSVTKDYNTTSVTETAGNAPLSYESGSIIGITIDYTNKEIKYYKNGTLIRTDSTPASYTPVDFAFYFLAFRTNDGTSGSAWADVIANFGQNPSFSGTVTAGTNADGNGKGLFKYAPPTGFLALCEDNLPTPAIADPGKHFKTVLYTGSQTPRSIQGLGFKPDLVWLKARSETSSNALYDSVRGPTLGLFSNRTDAEETDTNNLTSFDDDGFSLGTGYSSTGVNGDGRTYVAWCWKAGGAAVSNTDGSITTQVSANQTAGFSIVKGTQTSGTTTFGHGLGKAPKMVITKQTNGTTGWYTYHKDIGSGNTLRLDNTSESTSFAHWVTDPTTSVFSMGSGFGSGETYVAYCFAEIEGYSKIGSYVGNQSTDGPFVYCGFKPAFLLVKLSSTTNGHWIIWDSSRTPTNLATNAMSPNNNWAETANFDVDLLSNGFKQRDTETSLNASGQTYIFLAFAESPFQTANAK